MQKKWYTSKTIWANALAIAAVTLQSRYGFAFTPELQVVALGAINAILRTVTKEEITW